MLKRDFECLSDRSNILWDIKRALMCLQNTLKVSKARISDVKHF